MKVLVLSLLFSITLLAAHYPPLFSPLATPLYRAAEQLAPLKDQDTFTKDINIYLSLSKKSLEYGLKLEKSATKDEKKQYLSKLRATQKSYQKLSKRLQKSLRDAIKQDDYTLFLTLINTQAELFFEGPQMQEKVYAYYQHKHHRGDVPYLEKRMAKEKKIEVRYNPGSDHFSSFNSQNKQTLSRAPQVTVLSTPTCPYCKKAKRFLAKKGVRFTEYNVRSSQQGKRLYRKYGGSGVPIVIINGEVIRGYSPQRMEQALGQ